MFVRAPVLGTVKTRLARALGDRAALAAYEQLVDHALSQLRCVRHVQPELWVAGDPEHPQVRRWAERLRGVVHTQPPGDLGQRMHGAVFADHSAADVAMVVGTDCPTIDAALIGAAVQALNAGADVATAPAVDGGYGLIAMRTRVGRSFAHSPFSHIVWGSATVHADTLARCRALALRTEVLQAVWDVDEIDDWHRFQREFGAAQA